MDPGNGSINFLPLLECIPGISIVHNTKWLNHAKGLRTGIRHVDAAECSMQEHEKINYYLVTDSDVVITRSDLWPKLQQILQAEGPDAIGEIQLDAPIPYIHPCFMLIKKEAYHAKGVIPFVNGTAPALDLQISLRAKGGKIIDFPARRDGYIIHRGRGSIKGIREYRKYHPHATTPVEENFHGNWQAKPVWEGLENTYAGLLPKENGAACAQYIAEKLSVWERGRIQGQDAT